MATKDPMATKVLMATKVPMTTKVPMAIKVPMATKGPMVTKVLMATKVPIKTKSTNSNPRGLASYEIWACFDNFDLNRYSQELRKHEAKEIVKMLTKNRLVNFYRNLNFRMGMKICPILRTNNNPGFLSNAD